jgi:hypothetical protein
VYMNTLGMGAEHPAASPLRHRRGHSSDMWHARTKGLVPRKKGGSHRFQIGRSQGSPHAPGGGARGGAGGGGRVGRPGSAHCGAQLQQRTRRGEGVCSVRGCRSKLNRSFNEGVADSDTVKQWG